MVGIPRGAGQKGGVPKVTRKQKRQEKTAVHAQKKVVDRLANVASSHNSSHSPTSPESSYVNSLPAFAEVHGDVNVNGQRASAWSFNYSTPSPAPLPSTHWNGHCLSTMPPFPALFMPPPSTLSPSACNSASYSTASNLTNPVVSPYPFTLELLTPRIKICQGCRIPFNSATVLCF